MNIISILLWLISLVFNTPYLLNNNFIFIKPFNNNFCYLTTWRLVFIENIYYNVFLMVTLFIIPELIMIFICASVNKVTTNSEKDIVLNNASALNDSKVDFDSEVKVVDYTYLNSLYNTVDIIEMQSRLPQEIEMSKEERQYFNNLLKLKLHYLKLLISLLLCFVFSTLLTQVQLVIQKFGLFLDYQSSYEFKLYILLTVFLVHFICSVNCVIFLYFSKTLRKNSMELLERVYCLCKRQ
jgi:hypothetical protein